jgi:transcriptional regulator NrdR family protein
MVKTFKCPYCRSTQTTWKGYRKLVKGRVRLRKCKKCGRKYTFMRRAKND